MSQKQVYRNEQIKTIVAMFLTVMSLTNEIHDYLGDTLHLILLIDVVLLDLYQVVKLLYMVIIPSRSSFIKIIVPKSIKEVFK